MRTVSCPQCGAPALFHPDNRFRPFCSERCRLIDLGQWASESYKVPGQPVIQDDESRHDSFI